MKTPRCARAFLRFFGPLLVLCLGAVACHGQHFTGYDYIVPKNPLPNAITLVDGTNFVLPTGRSFVIGIEGGLRNPIKFINLTGTPNFPIMIVNKPGAGRVTISDAVPGNPTASGATGIEMEHCRHVKLRGDNDPAHRYGIEIARAGGYFGYSGQRGVDVTGQSSYVEIMFLEIHDIAFAGIMVKQDPECGIGDDWTWHPNLVYNDIKIHDNYIHYVGGEGMYVGYSFWTDSRCSGQAWAHNIHGLRIYNNLVEYSGWDGIQVGAAQSDVQIHNNVIIDSGTMPPSETQPGNTGVGVQIGGGTTGLLYNNLIINSRGNGVSLFGYDDNIIFNNLIYGGKVGIFSDSRPDGPAPGHPADRQTQLGAPYYIFNNTVINPLTRAFWSMSDITDNQFMNNLAVVSATVDPFILLEAGATATTAGNVFVTNDTGLAFANPGSGTYDYRILNSSTAVGQGVTLADVPFDIVGIPRPQGGSYDAGYSESGKLSVALLAVPPTSGNNGSINAAAINGTAPYNYAWSNGTTANPATNLGPGLYTVTVTDSAGASVKKATYLFTGADMGMPVSVTPPTQVEAPTFTAPSGTYGTTQNVTIATTTSGATIRYTTDGSTPTSTTGLLYPGPVAVSATSTLKAIAYKAGLTDSAVSVATYFIGVAPVSPVLSVAEVSDRKIKLSWTAPGGANRYELKYATTSGGPYTTLAILTTNSFTHSGLTNGTTCYYVMQASNIYGTSPDSAQASATPFPYVGALTILSGFTPGGTTGGSSATPTGAFNAQPTWDNTALTPVGNDPVSGSTTGVSADGKFGSIDFGTNFGSYHIVEMWTRYNPNSSGAKLGFASMWWDNDTDITNDGTTATPGMNFQNAASVPNSNTIQYWIRDREFAAAPIVPLDRYLILSTGSQGTNKPNEFAFVGWQDGAPAAPVFTQHPVSQTVPVGSSVSLTARASGSPTPTFQWRSGGENIPGATGQVLTLIDVQAPDAASYSVVATNSSGSATSNNAVLSVSGGSPTLTILTPAAVGTATGSAACTAAGAFNEQPTWDAVNGVPSGVAASPHATTTTAYTNRYWFIDLGTNYANIRITQMWTRYRPYSSGNHPGYAELWWDDDKDTINDGITASNMNFGNGQGLPSSASQIWERDRDFTGLPITPQGRYLMVSTGASPGDRPNEFAFVGYVVP